MSGRLLAVRDDVLGVDVVLVIAGPAIHDVFLAVVGLDHVGAAASRDVVKADVAGTDRAVAT